MSKRILMMDDSQLFLDLVGAALTDAGHAVEVARDLGEFEAKLGGADLVLMDVQMPEAFGDDLAMVVRHVRGSAAAIYLLSSLHPDELAARSAEAGLDGFISKQLGVEALVERVEQIAAELGSAA